MAPSNLRLVQAISSAWERGDWTATDWAHPDIEWVVADGPSPGAWQGTAGMAAGWHGFVNAWDGLRIEVEELRELDAERVLILMRWAGRGRTSGVNLGDLNADGAALFSLRDGRVNRSVIYLNRKRALRDLGLG